MSSADDGQSQGGPLHHADVDKDERARQRYRSLIRQLIAEFAAEKLTERGGQSYAMQRVGVDQSTLSKIMGQKASRNAGARAFARAVQKLKISSDYFYGDYVGTKHYKEFLLKPGQQVPDHPALTKFLERFENAPADVRPTEFELEQLRAWRPPEDRRVNENLYWYFFQGIREGLEPIAAEESARYTEKLRQGAKARGQNPPDPLPPKAGRKAKKPPAKR